MGSADQGERSERGLSRTVSIPARGITMPGRVLVVEDEDVDPHARGRHARRLGFSADEAGTAAEAMQKLRAPGADYAMILS
jgi:hypothetical protein